MPQPANLFLHNEGSSIFKTEGDLEETKTISRYTDLLSTFSKEEKSTLSWTVSLKIARLLGFFLVTIMKSTQYCTFYKHPKMHINAPISPHRTQRPVIHPDQMQNTFPALCLLLESHQLIIYKRFHTRPTFTQATATKRFF